MLLLRSSLFLSLHLSGNASSFPKPLSAEDEQAYLSRCVQGDLEARNILVERNMRLVAHIIKKYYTQNVDQDDLISIGTIGLIKGISSYRPEKNVRLATYAARCIENATLTEWHTLAIRSQKKHHGGTPCSIWLPDCI
jgi:RNA polymerase sporulation-specific sigma factor